MDDRLSELIEAGKRHYMAGEYVEATHTLRDAVEIAPDSGDTWRALGFALMGAGNPPDAIGAFHTAIGRNASDADAHYGLGLAMADMGDHKTAIEWFDKALAIKPGHARAKAALVQNLVKQGKLRILAADKLGGGASLERAVKLQPGSPDTVVPFVELLVDLQRYKQAFDVIEAALKIAPNDPALRQLHGELETDPRLAKAKRENSLM